MFWAVRFFFIFFGEGVKPVGTKTPVLQRKIKNWRLSSALDVGVRAGSWSRQLLRNPSQEFHYVWRGPGQTQVNQDNLTILILFQDAEMFHVSYEKIKQYMRRGRYNLFWLPVKPAWTFDMSLCESCNRQSISLSRAECNSGAGLHPLYVNVEMGTGNTATNWIDSLQAAFPGVQVCLKNIQGCLIILLAGVSDTPKIFH